MNAVRSLSILILQLCLWNAGSASAQGIEPSKDWQTAESAHFRVNYRSAWRVQAERVALAAERAYPKITKALAWAPQDKTEILLIDQFDLPNGFATPLPYNIIGVFLAPPDEGELLDNSDWLDLLLTHEFTHTVQLDKMRGVAKGLRNTFGRNPLLFPNLFQPTWAIEGLAVYNESDHATGRGRLRGPVFEAWLRAEASNGFLSLREINAGGRSLPVSKSYLYGAYFYEFLARRYGSNAIYKVVERYSGNFPLWPRLHTNPSAATGKTMDVLWNEFLTDLNKEVQQRAEPVVRIPETTGERMTGSQFDIGAVAALPGGGTLAVLDDGVNHAQLMKFDTSGKQTSLTQINRLAQLDVAPNGQVLVAQPDICNWRYLAFDLYRMDSNGSLQQLTHCARLSHAVQAGNAIVGIQQDAGYTRLVLLDAQGRQQRVLWQPQVEINLIDLAAAPDGRHVSVVSKQAGNWRVEQFDLAQPDAAPRLLFTHDAPVHGLRHSAAGLEFIAVRDGVFNVWRLADSTWVKLSHTHTRVIAHGGTQADGSLVLAVVAPGGYELRRIAAPAPLQRMPTATTGQPSGSPQETPATSNLGAAKPYQSWRSIAPRSWLPLVTGEQGLLAVGAATFGADALGWHQYAATLQYESRLQDWQGSLQYLYENRHLITFQRTLEARAWNNPDKHKDVISHDRRTSAQWLSLLPWLRLERRIHFGIGAAMDTVDRVHPEFTATIPPQDSRVMAALIDYNTSGGNWWSEGSNRGQHATLLHESYRPFTREGRNDYDGNVTRLDWRGFVPLGRSVLALRHTEAKAHGHTERFQLGGAVDTQLQLGYTLNSRDITLRGYRGDEPALRGANARATSIEWRTPFADVDRHLMVPAVGVNRLSGAVFFDIGGAWDNGDRPAHYQRSAGVELLGEIKLWYIVGLQMRLGVAHALDAPKNTLGYLTLGRAF